MYNSEGWGGCRDRDGRCGAVRGVVQVGKGRAVRAVVVWRKGDVEL